MLERKIRLIHLSDIHIRNYVLRNEYIETFNKLFEKIKEYVDENTYIVVTGDIFHNKINLSPESVDLAVYLFQQLSTIAPTIVIAGNHDLNLNNKDRLDCITPITNALQEDTRIYYLDKTDIYDIGGYSFGVLALNDKHKEQWNNILNNNRKVDILLYHGVVTGAKLDNNYVFIDNGISINFSKHIAVLLGDIHYAQNLSNNAAYAGSLIQQNFGEDVLFHGLIIWDIVGDKLVNKEFIEIESVLIYLNLNEEIFSNQDELVEYVRNIIEIKKPKSIQIKYICCGKNIINEATKSRIYQILKENNIKILSDITVNNINRNNQINVNDADDDNNKNVDNNIDIYNIVHNLNDINVLNTLIDEYSNKQFKLTSEDLSLIKNLNYTFFNEVVDEIKKQGIVNKWVIEKLEFSNLLSYGENNVIDFKNNFDIARLIGIFGNNATGKSSIIDIILFALYDRTSRTDKVNDIVNKNKLWFNVKLTIRDIDNNNTYVIERIGRFKEKHFTVDVNFTMIDSDNNVVNLTGTQRNETNKTIVEYFGNIDNILSMSICKQNDSTDVLLSKNSERKSFFIKLLNLDIFEKLEEKVRKRINENNVILKKYNYKQNTPNEILQKNVNLKLQLDKCNKEIIAITNNIQNKKNRIEEIHNNIVENSKKISNITELDDYIDEINDIIKNKRIKELLSKETITSINEYINNNNTNIDINNIIDDIKDVISRLNNVITSNNENKKKYENEILEYELKLNSYNNINELFSQLNVINKSINRLSALEQGILNELKNYSEDLYIYNNFERKTQYCEQCLQEILNLDINRINCYNNKLDKLKCALSNRHIAVETLNKKIDDYNKIKDILLKLNRKLQEIDNEKLLNDVSLLIRLLELIQSYAKYIDIINNNKIINAEIDKLENEKETIKKNIDSLEKTLVQLNSDKINIERDIEENTKIYNDIIHYRNELTLLDNYLLLVNKNGIPKYLINKLLPIIENEINYIISDIVDFKVKLSFDDNNFDILLHKPNNITININNASGFEQMLINLIYRTILSKYSNVSQLMYLFIDEGFGSFDTENINNVYNVLMKILDIYYTKIFIITHVIGFRDIVDKIISVEKMNNYSRFNIY